MYLLGWFWTITRSRPIGESGFRPFAWAELDAWTRLMQITLDEWELTTLLRLDRLWLSVMHETGYPFEDELRALE